MSRVLDLVLKKDPYDVMETGEKKREYRKDTPWIRSRLLTKNGERRHYDYVRLSHGYKKDRRSFLVEYKGFERAMGNHTENYSNGLTVEIEYGDFIINLGEIIKS